MEDSFKVRVDKVFGSLDSFSATSQSPAPSLRSLWSLTDDEVERKEWNRDKGEPEPEIEVDRRPGVLRIKDGPSSGIRELEEDLEDLVHDDLEDEDGDGQPSMSNKPDDYNDEEWEIKSSIGRDCTLDFEEEEDQYDKVAVGREKAGDRLYMKEVNDYGIDIGSGYELPSSLGGVDRDPRANRMAAQMRLKEDAEAAGNLDRLPLQVGTANSAAADSQLQPAEDDANLKSILKRKDGQSDSKSHKRVRFDPESIEKVAAAAEDIQMETEDVAVRREVSVPSQDFSSAVPDYIRNPSRYTQYTFDSSTDVDEQSYRQAYMDFLNTLKRSKGVEDESPAELPKSVTFVPRKKRNEAAVAGSGADSQQAGRKVGGEVTGEKRGIPIGIAAGDDQESEACAMEEDEMESAVDAGSSSKKSGRKYRVKATSEVEE